MDQIVIIANALISITFGSKYFLGKINIDFFSKVSWQTILDSDCCSTKNLHFLLEWNRSNNHQLFACIKLFHWLPFLSWGKRHYTFTGVFRIFMIEYNPKISWTKIIKFWLWEKNIENKDIYFNIFSRILEILVKNQYFWKLDFFYTTFGKNNFLGTVTGGYLNFQFEFYRSILLVAFLDRPRIKFDPNKTPSFPLKDPCLLMLRFAEKLKFLEVSLRRAYFCV